MLIKKKLIIFDLDGVLINSLPNMEYSWNMIRKKHDLPIQFSKYKKFIGLPFYVILNKLNITKNKKKIFNDYNYFSKKKISKIKFYKNTKKVLRQLKKNYYLAIYTSKNRERTHIILSSLKSIFDVVITPAEVKKGKPHPEGINKIKKIFDVQNKNIYFVGDSIFDKIAAQKARVNFLFACWGYGKIKGKYKKLIRIEQIFSYL
jgi:HAD superfamily hydrolase (TIGR01549 family)